MELLEIRVFLLFPFIFTFFDMIRTFEEDVHHAPNVSHNKLAQDKYLALKINLIEL